MISDLTVACVLKSGGIYTAEWVDRLQRGVAKYLTLPHRFVCLSDVDVPCERIPLVHDWPRWWSKIELFRPELFDGPVLYFDLDTVVVGSLDRMASYPHHFTATHEFYRADQMCSTAMAWRGQFGIYEAFAADPVRHMAFWDGPKNAKGRHVGRREFGKLWIGDQAFIESHLRRYDVTVQFFRDVCGSRSIASYKVHQCKDRPPNDAAVVAFHGFPKPCHFEAGWVAEQWA